MTETYGFDHLPDVMQSQDLMEIANYLFVEGTPFNKVLGMGIEWVEEESLCVNFEMREDLIGNTFRQLLHGGVTAAILDVVGGMAAFFSLRGKVKGQTVEKASVRFKKFGTVDLRIDYLRPGQGKKFKAKATVLRTGSTIAVARMEIHNEQNRLLAVGTGTYMVG